MVWPNGSQYEPGWRLQRGSRAGVTARACCNRLSRSHRAAALHRRRAVPLHGVSRPSKHSRGPHMASATRNRRPHAPPRVTSLFGWEGIGAEHPRCARRGACTALGACTAPSAPRACPHDPSTAAAHGLHSRCAGGVQPCIWQRSSARRSSQVTVAAKSKGAAAPGARGAGARMRGLTARARQRSGRCSVLGGPSSLGRPSSFGPRALTAKSALRARPQQSCSVKRPVRRWVLGSAVGAAPHGGRRARSGE